MVDVNIDLDGDQDRLESIELVRGWVAAYLIAERDRMTSDGLATYINANASILTDRPDVETVKLLMHGIDYAAQIIRYLQACARSNRPGGTARTSRMSTVSSGSERQFGKGPRTSTPKSVDSVRSPASAGLTSQAGLQLQGSFRWN